MAGLGAGRGAVEPPGAIGDQARQQQGDGRQHRRDRDGERDGGPGGDQGSETEQSGPPGQVRARQAERDCQQRGRHGAGAVGQNRDVGKAGAGADQPGREQLNRWRGDRLQELPEPRQTRAIAGQADQGSKQNQVTHAAHRCPVGARSEESRLPPYRKDLNRL